MARWHRFKFRQSRFRVRSRPFWQRYKQTAFNITESDDVLIHLISQS